MRSKERKTKKGEIKDEEKEREKSTVNNSSLRKTIATQLGRRT